MAVKGDKFKPEGSLKRFVEAGKKDSRVLKTVERHLIAKPAPNNRRSDVLHPSAMVKPKSYGPGRSRPPGIKPAGLSIEAL